MNEVSRKRLKIGDVIEIETPKGLAYFQYCNHDSLHGYLIRVLPGIFKDRPKKFIDLVKQKEKFFIFFPISAASNRGIVKIISQEEIPEHAKKMPLMRMTGFRNRNGQVLDWWLWDGVKEWKVGKLSEEMKSLSIARTCNDTSLIEKIVTDWVPEKEV